MKVAVIIPAAGGSARFGAKDKLSEDLGGRPLLLRTVEFFTKREDVSQIIVAGPKNSFADFMERFGPALSFHGVAIIEGGETRSDSVKNALDNLAEKTSLVAVHDAARPAITNELFDRLLLASSEFSAVAAGSPITGTIKRAEKNSTRVTDEDAIADSILGTSSQATVDAFQIIDTIDRTGLWEMQTPQIFDSSLLRRAYAQSDLAGCTDDAQVVEKLGEPVHLIEGDSRNIKVTTPADLALIRSILGIRGEQERPAHKRF